MRQVSRESNAIFDFILELYRSCAGDWARLAADTGISMDDLRRFLDYAAVFLGNVGNYFVRIPRRTGKALPKLNRVYPGLRGSKVQPRRNRRILRASLKGLKSRI